MAAGEDQIYNHTERTETIQYDVENVYKDGSDEELAFGNPKKYVPVYHAPQASAPIQYHEGHVEIGGPAETPYDDELFDEEILSYSGREVDIYPDAISVTPATKTIKVGETFQLQVKFTPDGNEWPVTWSSNASNKCSVDNGLITGIAEGENISVTATSCGLSASSTITVEKVPVTAVDITEESLALDTGADSDPLHVTVSPENATYKGVTLSSGNTDVATVDGLVVHAVAAGTTTITATSDDDNTKFDTCSVTVTDIPVTGIELDESSISLTAGETQQLTATISPETATDKVVNWSTSDGNVATVENGLVTAVAEGSATITAASHADGTITDTCTVAVSAAVEQPEETPGE